MDLTSIKAEVAVPIRVIWRDVGPGDRSSTSADFRFPGCRKFFNLFVATIPICT